MRLIDADVLKQHIDKLPALQDGNFAGNHSALKALINMQPTIQPEKAQLYKEGTTSDTISRQAAIDALKRFKPEIIPYEKARWYVEETIDTMHNRIEELPTIQPEPQWIPVSERLPKVGQTIIAQCRANIIKTLKLDSDGDWYQDAEHCYMSGFVVAWMPLPEPYKPNK